MAKKRAQPAQLTSEEPFPQLRLLFTDEVQARYEIARPILLKQPVSSAAR